MRAGARVAGLRRGAGRGVELADGDGVAAGAVLLAAGAHARRRSPAPPCRCGPSRARCCACATRRARACVERTIRTRDAYLVPRADGRYVLGATMEERGFDTAPTAGGVFELLRDISEVVPGVLELELEELLAGLRPATPDNLPAIGAGRSTAWSRRPATTATASCSPA